MTNSVKLYRMRREESAFLARGKSSHSSRRFPLHLISVPTVINVNEQNENVINQEVNQILGNPSGSQPSRCGGWNTGKILPVRTRQQQDGNQLT